MRPRPSHGEGLQPRDDAGGSGGGGGGATPGDQTVRAIFLGPNKVPPRDDQSHRPGGSEEGYVGTVSQEQVAREASKNAEKVRSKLYDSCTDVISKVESFLHDKEGGNKDEELKEAHNSLYSKTIWGRKSPHAAVHLREAALKIEHWKNSIRWCATDGQSTQSRTKDDIQAHLMLASLEKEKEKDNVRLVQTIQNHIDNVSERVEDVINAFESDALTRETILRELSNSVEGLALQLMPISTYADVVYRPQQLVTDSLGIQGSSTRISSRDTSGQLMASAESPTDTPLEGSGITNQGNTRSDMRVVPSKQESLAAAPTDEIPRSIRSAPPEISEGGLDEYKYTFLPTDKKRIRLIRLHPGELEDPYIVCEIFEADFLPDPLPGQILHKVADSIGRLVTYEALSWRKARGYHPNTQFAVNIRQKNGKMSVLRIPQTVGLALKHLRLVRKSRVLWIKEMCVNHKDIVERGLHASMLSLIYTYADKLCVWLGEDYRTRGAFEFVRTELSQSKDLEKLYNDRTNTSKWSALFELMTHGWFSNCWALPEIILASKVHLFCGPEQLEWREWVVATKFIRESDLSTLLRISKRGSTYSPGFYAPYSRLIDVTTKAFHENQGVFKVVRGTPRKNILSLEHLVTSSTTSDCDRPHDCIYAFIPIANDAFPIQPATVTHIAQQTLVSQIFGSKKPYRIDYSKPYPDVCTEFIQFCINASTKVHPSQALDILCRPWAKDWRPEDADTEDTLRLSLKKAGIVKTRKQGDWRIAWSEESANVFGKSDLPFFEQLTSGTESELEVDISSTTTRPDKKESQPASKRSRGVEESVNDRRRRMKTHTDLRSVEEYMQQYGANAKQPVRDFILRVFSTTRKEPRELLNQDEHASKHSSSQGQDEWSVARKVVLALVDDPLLEDIVHARAELEKVQQEKLTRAGEDGSHFDALMNHRKPTHPKIKELGLPSWVIGIDRKSANPLVGSTRDSHQGYDANHALRVDLQKLKIKKRPQLGHYSIYLRGFCFDRVAEVSHISHGETIPAAWLDLAGWPEARRSTRKNQDIGDPPEDFWRTLVASRDGEGHNPPHYFSQACKKVVLEGGTGSYIDITASKKHKDAAIAEFCRRAQFVLRQRRMIKTQKGSLGLVAWGWGPDEIKAGDLICIIYGCSVPVILRSENTKFKSRVERQNEELEDGIESMKRLVLRMERYREKSEYRTFSAGNRAKDAAKVDQEDQEARDTEQEREKYYRQEDTQSDIDGDNEVDSQDEDDARSEKQQERTRKAKIRDPLRHYTFLREAYIHGMMEGEAVNQKVRNGWADHIFEIR